MTPHTIPQTVLFPDLFDKPLVATFNQEHASSDGGAVLLKAAERVYGLVKAFAQCLADKRAAEKIRHTFADLIGQRIFGIACGHPDGNDADHLADDPIHKLLLGRDPVSGAPLASQPTISRFENGATRTALYRMGRELAGVRHRAASAPPARAGAARHHRSGSDRRPDARRPAAHVLQRALWRLVLSAAARVSELRPRGGAVSVRGGAAARQRSGRRRDPRAAVSAASRCCGRRFRGRGFSFGSTGALRPRRSSISWMRSPGSTTWWRWRKMPVLERHAESAMQTARTQSEVSGETAHVYTDTRYAARTWGHERRVVIKAEVVRLGERAPRDNPRFVVTNLRQTPRFIYEKVYCARGDIENRIKELLDGLQIDRTSCCRFWANQLRVLLTAAAYVLMQELRLRAAGTACARTQVTWLRDRLLKLGVQVVRSVRRLVLHLPRATPQREAWQRIALALGARAG